MLENGWHIRFGKRERMSILSLQSRLDQYLLAILIAVCIPALRALLNVAILKPAAKAAFTADVTHGLKPAEQKLRLRKWNEAGWKAAYRIVMIAMCVLASAKFFLEPAEFWKGCNKFPPCNFPDTSPGLRLAFALELGFYLEAIPFLLFFEVRRKDYWENLVHHLVTLALILYASELNFLKVGVAIIACHEINDVFMETAKMARYAGSKSAPVFLFTAFAISWIVTRLTYFPTAVIWNIYVETPKLAEKYGTIISPHREIFLGLLSTLLLLHIYWSVLIFKIVWQQLTKGELEDIREEPTKLNTDLKHTLTEKVE